MMTEYLSKKLRWLSILMTVLVVVIHAFSFDYLATWNSPLINHLLFSPSITIGRSAVPLFFLISGLLFFKDGSVFSFSIYKNQVWKRVKTVLIPFLAVSAFFMLLVWLSYRDFVPAYLHLNYLLPEYSPKWMLTAWILKPQAYYLWFLRNLFALTIFSPLIYFAAKKGGWFVIVPALLAWMFFSHMLPSFTLSVVFFILGAYIAIKQVNLPQKIDARYLVGLIAIWIVLMILPRILLDLEYMHIMKINNMYTFLGILVAWFSYDYINAKFIDRVCNSRLAYYIFSVYLFHHIFLTLFQQACLHFVPDDTLAYVLPIYYLSIPFAIALAMSLAMLLQKLTPSVYRVITGSR